MRSVHARLAGIEKLHYRHEKERALLTAADGYCSAVQNLKQEIESLDPASAGLRGLCAYLVKYTTESVEFMKLASDTHELLSALDAVHYGLLIRSGSVTVRKDAGEADFSVEVEDIFAKFQQDIAQEAPRNARGRIGINSLNHIEAQILDRVALLYPQTFATLDAFCAKHELFADPVIERLAREACFYLAWLRYTEPLRRVPLPFCYPVVDTESKATVCEDGFDLALSVKLAQEHRPVVRNSVTLCGAERIIVVSGPNHGGKTTFARMFGQLHWLAALGLSVPGARARLFLFDRLFTHFEKEEDIATLRGKLQDDLVRIHQILKQATPRSVIVLNEIFASTTLNDAVRLGQRIMARLSQLDALSVCVTFLTELADFNEKTVSAVAMIEPRDPALRTFKVERRPADGLAYALAIANKYRVTRAALLQRIAP
jgi:DNA mismatch repair ATPase MutS